MKDRCPREDPNNFTAGDIFEVECLNCKEGVEFIADEASRKCPKCKEKIANPRVNSD